MKRFLAVLLMLLMLGNTSAFAFEAAHEDESELYIGPIKTDFVFNNPVVEGEPAFNVADFEVYALSDAEFIDDEECDNGSLQLMSTQESLEQCLMNGWDNVEEGINVYDYRIKVDDFTDAYRKVLYQNPIYYYVNNGYSYLPTISGYIYEVRPNYKETDKDVISSTIDQINKATEEILFFVDENMSDFEKIMTVHDYMALHYEYDYSYTIYDLSIMLDKTGVCMAYTLAFTHLMNQLGIETYYVSSEAMNHAWNLVKLDGEWYHIDLTWDDHYDRYGFHEWTDHAYALLSDSKIQSLESAHYDYNLGDLSADSTIYDDAAWHDGISSLATVNDVSYWIAGNDIVNEYGETIYSSLDGGDGKWSIGNGYVFSSRIYSTLSGYNGELYFNTDKGIYRYTPDTKEISLVKDIVGVCGMYIHKNELVYDKYDFDQSDIVKAGSFFLGNVRYSTPYISDNKLITKVYKDDDEPMKIFNFGLSGCQMATIDHSGYTTVEFDAEDEQNIFFWDENLKPLRDKLCITNQ